LKILDNEKYIYKHNASKLIDILLNFPSQFKNAEQIFRETRLKDARLELKSNYKNAIVLGIGNPSTVAFKLLLSADINQLKIPVSFSSTSEIPSWVDKNTLIVALSHSGNTIEVLESVDKLTSLGYQIIAITGGGRLKEKAQENKNIILIEYHKDLLPRMAIGYAYVLMVEVLSETGLLRVEGFSRNMPFGLYWNDVENELSNFTKELTPEVPINSNIAKKIAINLFEKIPVIYGSSKITGTVAYRFKTQFCTVAKTLAHFNVLPDVNHDEITGWEVIPELRKDFIVLFITEDNIDMKIKKTIDLMHGIFLERNIKYLEIQLEATNSVVKAFKGFFLADWISLYLSILYDVDPNEITLIDKIKNRLTLLEKNNSS